MSLVFALVGGCRLGNLLSAVGQVAHQARPAEPRQLEGHCLHRLPVVFVPGGGGAAAPTGASGGEHAHCLLRRAPVQEERVVAVQLLKEAQEVWCRRGCGGQHRRGESAKVCVGGGASRSLLFRASLFTDHRIYRWFRKTRKASAPR